MAKGLSKMERLAHSVGAGVYMTFGAFIEDFNTLTKALETALRIELTDDDDYMYEDYELSVIKDYSNAPYHIKYFCISDASIEEYHLSETEVLYPNYLITCNIVEKEETGDTLN